MTLREEARGGEDVDAWLRGSFDVAAAGPDLDPISLEQTRKGAPIEALTLGAAVLCFVGKHSACAVQLDHPSLSRRHAVLLRDKARRMPRPPPRLACPARRPGCSPVCAQGGKPV